MPIYGYLTHAKNETQISFNSFLFVVVLHDFIENKIVIEIISTRKINMDSFNLKKKPNLKSKDPNSYIGLQYSFCQISENIKIYQKYLVIELFNVYLLEEHFTLKKIV